MLVKANVSFAGLVTMFGGEERDIKDEQVAKDLLACGYVRLLEENKGNISDPATGDDSKHTGNGSHDEPPESKSGGADTTKQQETTDENKRTAK